MAKYSEEMREQTAAYIIESKRSITQVAKEIGVNVNTLCRWVNDYRKRHNMPTGMQRKCDTPTFCHLDLSTKAL